MDKTALEVQTYLENLNHPLKDVVLELRSILLKLSSEISEHIKWNSLSFIYTGEIKSFDAKEYKRDIAVLNLLKKEYVLVVLPTGSAITNNSELLEGNFKDTRKVVKFYSLSHLKENEKEFEQIVLNWLENVEK